MTKRARCLDSIPSSQVMARCPRSLHPMDASSNVICFDGDFPYLSRQAGQAHADLM
jgi:hypothetical protein